MRATRTFLIWFAGVSTVACSNSPGPAPAADAGQFVDAMISFEVPDSGQTGDDAGPSADGGAPDGGSVVITDGGVCLSGASCNQIAQLGQFVPELVVADYPPTPTGGTLQPATYVVSAVTIYAGPGGPTLTYGMLQETAIVTGNGGNIFQVQQVSGMNGCTQWANGTLALDGTSAALTQSCPSTCLVGMECSFSGNYSVSADGTTVSLFVPSGGTTIVLTLDQVNQSTP
jgi:hypothetical protein